MYVITCCTARGPMFSMARLTLVASQTPPAPLSASGIQGCLAHKNRPPLQEPYGRPMPRALWWS